MVQFLPNGGFYIDDYLWNKAKGDYCRNENVGLHIDDSAIYGKYFTTPYAHFNAQENVLQLPQQTISLNLSADKIFHHITEFMRQTSNAAAEPLRSKV